MLRAFLIGAISLLSYVNGSSQRAYLVDISKTALVHKNGEVTETLSTDFLPDKVKRVQDLIIAKKYSHWVINDTTFLADLRNQALYKKLPGEPSIYIRDDHSAMRNRANESYQQIQGDFVGNIQSQFCREYIITNNKDHFSAYKCAAALPYTNIFELPYSLPGFPVQQDIVITKNGHEVPVRMTFNIEKAIIPKDMAIQIKILENQISNLSGNQDRCPEDKNVFDKLDQRLIRQISEAVSPYPTKLSPYPNMIYNIPVLDGSIDKLELFDGEELTKTVLYNNKSQPIQIVNNGSNKDTLDLQYPMQENNILASFPIEAMTKDDNLQSTYFDQSTRTLIDRKEGKLYASTVDEDLKFTEVKIKDLSADKPVNDLKWESELKYQYKEDQLTAIYNQVTEDNEDYLTYYDSGLLRSWNSKSMTFDGLRGQVCYSYAIGEIKPGLWEAQITRDWPFSESEINIYRFDSNFNVIYSDSRFHSTKIKKVEDHYNIIYSNSSSADK